MKKYFIIFPTIIFLLIGSCIQKPKISEPDELNVIPISTPSSYDQAINYLNGSAEERIAGCWTLANNYSDHYLEFIPLVINNLHYQPTSDVRENSAKVLGELGTTAKISVPNLIEVMENDNSNNARIEAAIALGKIKDSRAMPALSKILDSKNIHLSISAAKSMSKITGVIFPDSNSTGGYSINNEGKPLIVVAAKKWWTDSGSKMKW